ncbi:pyridoxal phosphate-dependent aminotransferase [Selenomonas timonae]|uniref:cysteine-S-conjugate beta-lyase n=1 Tax=Selenomonas timonae TaxID=2754044 RepID=A0A7G7VKG0_9FIRM|nr:MalY/PatB family protein [Selenomonas timonae]QNH54603.1 pyridoxal phosphate-dependent aminotransferase [Selenomonas timonae]
MPINFDEIIDRRNTSCLKYDFAAERGYPADILPFWVADMDFRTPTPVIDALKARAEHGIFGYTQVKDDYVIVLQNWFRTRHDWAIERSDLIITPGVVFAIANAIRAFTKKSDAVLIQQPVYYPFANMIRQNERILVDSPLRLIEGHYEIDFEDFEQKVIEHSVKLFILCSPHNPVGRVWTRAELEQLAAICLRHNVIVVADEIHEEFVRPGFRHIPFAAISDEAAAITVTCTSPSKTFNLAGLQISNIFIRDKELRHRFKEELSRTGYDEPNTLGLAGAKAAYEYGAAWLTELLAYLEENNARTRAFLAQHLPKVTLIEPEGTYLLWLDFSAYGLSDEELNAKIIRDAYLWLDDGPIFGAGGSGFQRINIACPWATLEQGLKNLAEAFA